MTDSQNCVGMGGGATFGWSRETGKTIRLLKIIHTAVLKNHSNGYSFMGVNDSYTNHQLGIDQSKLMTPQANAWDVESLE
jgi:hypothetical protein